MRETRRNTAATLILALAALQSLAGSPASAVVGAYADAQRLPSDARPYARYLGLWTVSAEARPEFLKLLRHQLASVDTLADFPNLYPAGPDLVRIDLREFQEAFGKTWDDKTPQADPLFHLTVEVASWEEVEVGHFEAYGKRAGQTDPGAKWVKTGTRKKEAKSGRKSVLATEVIEGCPTCRGWLPTAETLALAEMTYSQSPVLNAEWVWARMARQLPLSNVDDDTGYYSWNGFKSRDDFFKVMHIREEDRVRIIRAAVDAADSGVAQNGRQYERDDSPFGGYHFTLDTNNPTGDGNPTHRLKRGEFKHQAEEYYAFGANGLPFLLLCTDQGVLQATAPDFIGSNGSPGYGGRDFRIHVPLSCIDCHSKAILRPVDDFVRKTFGGVSQLRTPDFQTHLDFQHEFFSNLEKRRARDAAAFADAITEVSGLTPEKLVVAYDAEWQRYANAPLTAEEYATLLGYSKIGFLRSLKDANDRVGGVDPILVPLLRGGTINRVNAEELFSATQDVLRGAP